MVTVAGAFTECFLIAAQMAASGSLTEQLRWIREQWGFVAERFGDRLVISLDVLNEEERANWMRFHATHGGADDAGDTDTAALHGFEPRPVFFGHQDAAIA